MGIFQIIILSNHVQDSLLVHAMESYKDTGYPYSCLLDVSFPEGKVIRTVGFSEKEEKLLIQYLIQNMAKIQKYSDKDVPLFVNVSLQAAKNTEKVTIKDGPPFSMFLLLVQDDA